MKKPFQDKAAKAGGQKSQTLKIGTTNIKSFGLLSILLTLSMTQNSLASGKNQDCHLNLYRLTKVHGCFGPGTVEDQEGPGPCERWSSSSMGPSKNFNLEGKNVYAVKDEANGIEARIKFDEANQLAKITLKSEELDKVIV